MGDRKQLIAPSILSADFANLAAEVEAVSKAGADWIHVDVMDGHFVPNITIGPVVVKSLRKASDCFFDVHLMIEKPEVYIKDFADAGADLITFHIEAVEDVGTVIRLIRECGCKVGITLRPKTSLEEVLPYIDQVDMLLVMTVEPGFGGQSFMHDQVDKIKQARKHIDDNNLSVLIEVDGGVSAETIQYLGDVDVLVAGSYIFKRDYKEAIDTLKGDS